MTLAELAARFARIDPDAVAAVSLAALSFELAGHVREALSEPAGEGAHIYPWLRAGALRDSIAAQADGSDAVVGSPSEVARYQEQGTAAVPPRPFLAPVAAERADGIAAALGAAVAAALSPHAAI